MRTFQILYLRDNVLERAEKVRVADVLSAVRAAADQPPDVTVEIWCGEQQVAVIKPVGRR